MATSNVANWYKNQHVFVTGATGFMGKVLVEKLLRSCPDIDTIYILIRPKGGKDVARRLEDFIKTPIFDKIRDLPDGASKFKKLKCIAGDVMQKDCGISEENKELLSNVTTTVFHMAAYVKFDQPLKSAILVNVGGTLNVLELCAEFKKTKAFVYVSTSYCHLSVDVVEEKLYPAPHDPRKMLGLVKWLDAKLLDVLSPSLLAGYPNTYAYTKCLTEQMVSEFSKELPIIIVRPSIVTAAYKEPIPGWIDNLNGPTGIIVAAGKGVVRTMHCNADLCADIVPVDMVMNGIILVTSDVGTEERRDKAQVYNITANKDDPLSWRQALELGKKHLYDNPFSVCLWYPGGGPKSSYIIHVITAFFLHLIPAYLIDFLLVLTGNKPFMIKIQKRINTGLILLQYYTTREWNFANEKLAKIVGNLNEHDRKTFYTNREHLEYDEYMLNYVLGARKYCAKEDPETLPYARKILKRLYYLDRVTHILLCGLFLWICYSVISYFLVKV